MMKSQLLSGLEALTVTPSQLERLEKTQMLCLRRIGFSTCVVGEEIVSFSNVGIRTYYQMPSIDTALKARRIKFWQSMCNKNNVWQNWDFFAIMLGASTWSTYPFDDTGKPKDICCGYMRLIFKDLEDVAQVDADFGRIFYRYWHFLGFRERISTS